MSDSTSINYKGIEYHKGFHFNTGLSPEDDGLNIWCMKKDFNDDENRITITIHNNECTEIKNDKTIVGKEYAQQILSLDIKEEDISRLANFFDEVSKMLKKNYI